MEDSQSHTELTEEEMSFKERNPHPRSHRQTFGQGLFTVGGGSVFPHGRLVILSLGLLDAVLLIAAVVIAIFCAKAGDLQVPHSAAITLMVEAKYLSNHTNIIKSRSEAEAALARERTNYVHIKLHVKQQKKLSDVLQRQTKTLLEEKTNLQANKTALEESCGRCQPGWNLLKSSCYYFSYPATPHKENWNSSRTDCISRGGDLIVIDSLAEQQLISDNVPELANPSSTWYRNGFWIGLSHRVEAGTWVWVNNVTEEETMYWKNGQPSQSGAQSGNCAALFYWDDTTNTWYNGDCDNLYLYWICEVEPSKT